MNGPADAPVVSVVVPCRHHAVELASCLRSLSRQNVDMDYEIVVVDSAADPAVAEVAAEFPRVRLVRSTGDLVPGEARNLGAHNARGKWLAFTDADCQVEEGWLRAAVAELEDGTRLAGGPVLDMHPFHPIASMDNLMQFTDFSPLRPDGAATHLPGCNFAISRSSFDELGGFRPETPIAADTLLTGTAADRWPNGVRFSRRMRIRHEGRTRLAEFWRHHERFGFHRGRFGLRLSPWHRRLGGSAVFAPIIAVRRLIYFFIRAVQWYPSRLPRLILFQPVLWVGLTAWAVGFRSGSHQAATEPT